MDSAPPGFNPNASLLPDTNAVIHTMRGGQPPATNTSDSDASKTPEDASKAPEEAKPQEVSATPNLKKKTPNSKLAESAAQKLGVSSEDMNAFINEITTLGCDTDSGVILKPDCKTVSKYLSKNIAKSITSQLGSTTVEEFTAEPENWKGNVKGEVLTFQYSIKQKQMFADFKLGVKFFRVYGKNPDAIINTFEELREKNPVSEVPESPEEVKEEVKKDFGVAEVSEVPEGPEDSEEVKEEANKNSGVPEGPEEDKEEAKKNSEVPEVPEGPETPEVPEGPEGAEEVKEEAKKNSGVPEVPESPETPEIPEVPEGPEVSEELKEELNNNPINSQHTNNLETNSIKSNELSSDAEESTGPLLLTDKSKRKSKKTTPKTDSEKPVSFGKQRAEAVKAAREKLASTEKLEPQEKVSPGQKRAEAVKAAREKDIPKTRKMGGDKQKKTRRKILRK
jgi:hypothetical protein